jgi:DNA-binding IclR family transcriptional regulator
MTTRTPRQRPALDGVAAADRALAILSAFRKGDRHLTLAALSERTGLVKSTIMRLAVSLEAQGYLARTPDGAYRLDAELLRLGSLYRDAFGLEAHVLPVLEALVAATGETAGFYVRHGERRLCLFRVDSPHLLRMHVRPGETLPMDDSATAQVLRAFARRPPRPMPKLPVWTSGATDPDTASLAMPVFGPGAALAGALMLSGPISRLDRRRAEAAMPLLRDAAAGLTRALGGEAITMEETA